VKEPLRINGRDALMLHGRLLALDGGSAGLRSLPLLESALARPRQLHAYGQAPDKIDLAVAYTAGIIRITLLLMETSAPDFSLVCFSSN
jgi:death on curing protein